MAIHTPAEAVAWLRTPAAIRERCKMIFAAAEMDQLKHFALDLTRLDGCADFVIETIRKNYPDLIIPVHSRWRHFTVDGVDRWAQCAETLDVDVIERGRIRTELVILSVLLDAGAGAHWRYVDHDSGLSLTRSEGLAIASFNGYIQGLFSQQPKVAPQRADAEALVQFSEQALEQIFQASTDNPLIGVSGRTALLQALGHTLKQQPQAFGEPARLGCFFDYLLQRSQDHRLAASEILEAILESFSTIWPGRLTIADQALGDVWRHSCIQADDLTHGLVPLHKLSQWLSYSLLEPLQEAGITVTDLNALTGLAEYRNGGLFIDTQVVYPKHEDVFNPIHRVDSELIVEWRALTVILLDQLAERIRYKLNRNAETLPLANVLEGGSWHAGRHIATSKRSDGSPPLQIDSDGTVF